MSADEAKYKKTGMNIRTGGLEASASEEKKPSSEGGGVASEAQRSDAPLFRPSTTPLESPASYFRILRNPKPPANMESLLLEPFCYIADVPGKGVRSMLIKAFNHWLEVPDEQVRKISEVVEMLHNASLLIDDVQDGSELRRGVPCAHKVYGVAQVINSANYVYMLAMEKVAALGHPDALSVCLEEMLQLHRGQGLELVWRDNVECPTEEEYQRAVLDKTGGLTRLSSKLLTLFAQKDEVVDLVPLANLIALHYQIRDDVLNLTDKRMQGLKGFCDDLTEGKFSFPVIHAIRARPNDSRLINIIRQRTTDPEVKRYAVRYMHSVGSFVYAEKVLNKIRDSILDTIAEYGGNELLTTIVVDHLCKPLDLSVDDDSTHDAHASSAPSML
ncbi:farnesyltranstransferase [Thecamonas trahens ATCC 50062]|uniref:Farnesyltranstransferase n=1 Tax=Thecamonas trahens ATCC 50062 TaxID=461836 RepID=A0A0L0D473_THETB|nr:farnesyltranstransferase [Thecamonas trahens ATCC 50062]KNC46088.1 farnesyltranstransferase [Thecamonas trahens ATCC 50062]|eukprot:XP_013763068.1 farnesyltranstransferase [Thecamonas trahens ATCC 50062]